MSSVRVPKGTPVLDCRGGTITAGFWNSHVHFFERKWANAAAISTEELGAQLVAMLTRYGFTSVFDLGSDMGNTLAIRRRIDSGEVPGPRIRTTGTGLIAVNPGIPSDAVLGVLGVMKAAVLEIASPPDAAAAARKLLVAGTDGIKMFASAPSGAVLPDGAIAAAAAEARRSGKPLFVHTNSAADILSAARGGADIIAHTTPRSPWNEEVVAAMKQRGMALTPTLWIWKSYLRHDRLTAQQQAADAVTAQLRAWAAAGGIVLFGNDLGAVDYDPTPEYELMAQSGMDFRQILASLTTAPANKFGQSEQYGRIAPGLQADLVVLDGDPSRTVRAFGLVRYTVRAGRIIYRAGH
jgi:imidazolonepropionase-like amidohydrolase